MSPVSHFDKQESKHNHIRNFSESTLSTWTKLAAKLK